MAIEIPEKLGKLLSVKARIKVIYGGRGGGKTVSISDIVVAKMASKRTRILGLREFQNSIADSVHSTLQHRIERHGFDGFDVLTNEIRHANGSQMMYGQLARNIESIKSKDSIDLAWVEEAETVSDKSIEILEPSIRAEGSEIWYSLNPKSETGAVYKRYIQPYLHEIEKSGFYYTDEFGGLLVIKINLVDNPFAPQELLDDSARLLRDDPKKWRHIYGGEIILEDVDNNLIKSDDIVFAAQKKSELADQSRAPLIIGVDPARFGKDASAIIRRQGRKAFGLVRFYNQDTMTLAGRCAVIIKAEKPDAMFIDVGGLGAGVYDRLVELGYGDIVKPVNFGGKPIDSDRFYNKRSEMWGLMGDWIKEIPNQIPDDSGLISDLVTPQYSFTSDGRMKLESKDDMKKRLGRSPDVGDALALTFAMPVGARGANKQAEVVVAPFVPMSDVGW